MDDATLQTRFSAIEASLKAMDTQIALISEKLGLPYGESDDGVPAIVRELAAAGKRIDAIKELRQATGYGLAQAKEIVDAL